MNVTTLALVGALSVSGCFVVPPSRTNAAVISELSTEGRRTGYRLTTGAHSASWESRPKVGFDLGVGYIYERFEPEPAEHGTYVELGAPIATTGKRRLWVAGRGEVFWTERGNASPRRGLVARLAVDRFLGGGSGGKDSAGFQGSGSLEAFAEFGLRSTRLATAAATLIIGVGFRAPLFGGSGSPGVPIR